MRGNSYRDLSTVCIVPVPGSVKESVNGHVIESRLNGVPPRVLQSWFSMMTPMNQKFTRLFISGMEVGEAYNSAIEFIVSHPELSKWKYVLTLEWDNMPPPDGLLKLYESIELYDVVGGLYWTKGEGGQPMIYGDPDVMPMNFIPQVPRENEVQRCNGLGMGFNLFKMKIFKDPKVPKPWFKTVQEFTPGVGSTTYTQDLYFYQNAGLAGYKFACDNRVRVGHFDAVADLVW
jgi:hypothetical protein